MQMHPPVVKIYQSKSQISFSNIHNHIDYHQGGTIKDMAFIKNGKVYIYISIYVCIFFSIIKRN
jgi:hypothetical protein